MKRNIAQQVGFVQQTILTKRLTPVFNTPTFETELHNLKLVEGLWRPLETLLPPTIPVHILEHVNESIDAIQTPAYPSSTPLYVHQSFLKKTSGCIEAWSPPPLPPLSTFLTRIKWCVSHKIPYLWGGNAPKGTPSLLSLYHRAHHSLPETEQRIWSLRGVDCSGLIYWATQGATLRNTSDLIREGKAVEIEGLCNLQIANRLKPGMILVWKGHVLIVTEEGIVDSTPEQGVSLWPLQEKLDTIRLSRKPLNAWPVEAHSIEPSFVVRDLYANCQSPQHF